ncbi:MAG: MBL fold metallo-hydrolase [Polyangiales bacterium]
MSPRLTFAGAARGVTGSCYHLEKDGFGLVIDCGIFQGEDGAERNLEPFPFDAASVDAVVLTHGHLDHVGRLPLLSMAGFRGQVHGHGATLDVARLILEDSAKIGTFRGRDALYGAEDVEAVLERTKALPYGERRTLGPFTVTTFDAGHILGSASVRVAWKEGNAERAILFSGDLGSRGAPILREPNERWNAERDSVDFVVTESTYGDRSHPSRAEARETFRASVLRAVSDGGKVLIPAFAVGRTQEVLYDLNVLVESGKLPGIPVIVDGPLGLAVTELYERYTDLYDEEALAKLRRGDLPLSFEDLYAARRGRDSARVREIEGPAILVAGSGMCSGGRIVDHLATFLPDRRTDVIFVGYQAEGTLGRSLQGGSREVVIDGERVAVRAKVTTISGFSAHADRDGLAGWFEDVPRRGAIRAFVTHGEAEATESYARLLRDRFAVETSIPALGESVVLERS